MNNPWLTLTFASALLGGAFSLLGQIQPVARPARPPTSGSGGSYTPSVTPDGRFVLFASQANNLVTNDDLGIHLDLFVRDLATRRTTLVSVSTNGHGGANGNCGLAALCSNGQFVVFESAASYDRRPTETDEAHG